MTSGITSLDHPERQIIRENKNAWRLEEGSLYMAALPGTLWGTDHNNAQNLVVYPKPDSNEGIIIEVYIKSDPKNNGEQAGLIIYANDDHYVKFVKELVNHQHVVVLAVEVEGCPAVHAKLPIHTGHIGLRMTVRAQSIYGEFKEWESNQWQQLDPVKVPTLTDWIPGLIAHGGEQSNMGWGKFSNLLIQSL